MSPKECTMGRLDRSGACTNLQQNQVRRSIGIKGGDSSTSPILRYCVQTDCPIKNPLWWPKAQAPASNDVHRRLDHLLCRRGLIWSRSIVEAKDLGYPACRTRP